MGPVCDDNDNSNDKDDRGQKLKRQSFSTNQKWDSLRMLDDDV